MRKVILIVVVGFLTILSAEILIEAKAANKITKQETKKLEKKIMQSPNGKKAYNGLIKFFNKNIAKISSGGYYNSFVITYMNDPKKISELLKPLTKKEQDVMRSLVIRELIKKGYSIKYNQYWNNEDAFRITISW